MRICRLSQSPPSKSRSSKVRFTGSRSDLRREGRVVRIRFDVGPDSSGDDAVHFRIVMPDESFDQARLDDEMN